MLEQLRIRWHNSQSTHLCGRLVKLQRFQRVPTVVDQSQNSINSAITRLRCADTSTYGLGSSSASALNRLSGFQTSSICDADLSHF